MFLLSSPQLLLCRLPPPLSSSTLARAILRGNLCIFLRLLDLVWRSQNLPLMIWSMATSPLTTMKGPEAAFWRSPCHPVPVQIQKLFTQRTLMDTSSTHLNICLWMDRWMDEWMTFEADNFNNLCKLWIRLCTLSASSDSSPTDSTSAGSFHQTMWKLISSNICTWVTPSKFV